MKQKLTKVLAIVLCAFLGASILAACGPDKSLKGQYTYNSYLNASPLNWNPHAHETNADSVILQYLSEGFVERTMKLDSNGKPIMLANGFVEQYYELVMASELPKDVTSQYVGQFGIEVGNDMRAFEVKLKSGLKWDNGDPIVAKDFYDSAKYLLDPDMKNQRAENFVSGVSAWAGASAYFNSGTPDYRNAIDYDDDYNATINFTDESEIKYFSFSLPVSFFGLSANTIYTTYGYTDEFMRGTENLLSKWLARENNFGLIELTATNRTELLADLRYISENFGDLNPNSWHDWGFLWDGVKLIEGVFDNVGIKYDAQKNSVTIIYANEMSQDDMMIYMGSGFLVHKGLYEANYVTTGELKSTSYNTSAETTRSHGPYKLSSFQKDKEFVLEKNTNWHGWSEDQYKNQYNATKIKIQIIKEHNTLLLEFLKGNMDDVDLFPADMAKYSSSSNLQIANSYYSMRMYMNSDLTKLKAIEADANTNTQNLAYFANKDFREALSFCINRKEAVKYTSGWTPSFTINTTMHFYDNENQLKYLDNDYAKQAIVDAYGIEYGPGKTYKTLDEAYNNLTGFDKDHAKALFTKAFDAVNNSADIKVKNGDVKFNFYIGSGREDEQKPILEFIQTCINEATKGTGLDGKVKLTVKEYPSNGNRYLDLNNGQIEVMFGAVGAMTAFPEGILAIPAGFETSANYNNCLAYGTNPMEPLEINFSNIIGKTVDIIIDEETKETKKYNLIEELVKIFPNLVAQGHKQTLGLQEWLALFRKPGEGQFKGDYSKIGGQKNVQALTFIKEFKAIILPRVEMAFVKQFREIPIAYDTTAYLYSKKVKFILDKFDDQMQFGGLRYMTFVYDDYDWARAIKGKNFLDYTV